MNILTKNTPEIRAKIYKLMLEKIVSRKSMGFCAALIDLETENIDIDRLYLSGISELPELWVLKPKKRYRYGAYWYKPSDINPRIRDLNIAIMSIEKDYKPVYHPKFSIFQNIKLWFKSL
jgi:hypothetical protein